MKKIGVLIIAIGFFASSCLPAPATDIPVSSVDLDATAAVFVQQTLDAMPSVTAQPTNTPVVINETATVSPTVTPTAQIESGTPNQTLTTETTPTSTGTLATIAATQLTAGTLTATLTSTPNANATATQTLHPRFYGTLPPNLPYNGIELLNKSKAEAYISLQGTTTDGYTTILEYPVGKLMSIEAPIGKYKYVAWVGGNKLMGSFVLGNDDLRITIFKDRIEIKKR